MWSRSLHATADMFSSLKANQEEPDPRAAALVGNTQGNLEISSDLVINDQAIEVLRKLPGVTDSNFRPLMGACTCLADLADMSLSALEGIIGSKKNAKLLRDFLDAPCPRHFI